MLYVQFVAEKKCLKNHNKGTTHMHEGEGRRPHFDFFYPKPFLLICPHNGYKFIYPKPTTHAKFEH